MISAFSIVPLGVTIVPNCLNFFRVVAVLGTPKRKMPDKTPTTLQGP